MAADNIAYKILRKMQVTYKYIRKMAFVGRSTTFFWKPRFYKKKSKPVLQPHVTYKLQCSAHTV